MDRASAAHSVWARDAVNAADCGRATIWEGTPLMIETWLNLFGLLSGAFLLIDFQLQAPALHGDSHEKWIKETRLDISAGSGAEDNGPQENPRRPNCQEVETNRRRHAPKSVQYGIVTRFALTTRSLQSAHVISFLIARNIDGCVESATSL